MELAKRRVGKLGEVREGKRIAKIKGRTEKKE